MLGSTLEGNWNQEWIGAAVLAMAVDATHISGREDDRHRLAIQKKSMQLLCSLPCLLVVQLSILMERELFTCDKMQQREPYGKLIVANWVGFWLSS